MGTIQCRMASSHSRSKTFWSMERLIVFMVPSLLRLLIILRF